MRRYNKGFTLLELMIAILIFTMISTAAYKLFDSVTRAQQETDGLFEGLDELQRLRITLEKDLLQIAARPIRNEYGDWEPAIMGPVQDKILLVFTRTGWRNPLQSLRSDLQRVAYVLDGGVLQRYYWPVLDRAPDPVFISQELIRDVKSVQIRFMDGSRSWKKSWPIIKERPARRQPHQEEEDDDELMGTEVPEALEMVIRHEYYGVLDITVPLVTVKDRELYEAENMDLEGRFGESKKRAGADGRSPWGGRN